MFYNYFLKNIHHKKLQIFIIIIKISLIETDIINNHIKINKYLYIIQYFYKYHNIYLKSIVFFYF